MAQLRALYVNTVGRLPSLRRKYVRRYKRFGCCIVATMNITERHFDADGIVLELSQGGLLFRPASLYIMERMREHVSIRFEGLVLDGIIMHANQQGYGIRLTEEISEDRIQQLIKSYGLSSLKDKQRHKLAKAAAEAMPAQVSAV